MNKAILFGRSGNDPELRTTQNGTNVASVSLATHKLVRGNWETTWHSVIFWGKAADSVAQRVTKGTTMLVTGEIVHRKWTDGKGEPRLTHEIHSWDHPEIPREKSKSNEEAGGDKEYPF